MILANLLMDTLVWLYEFLILIYFLSLVVVKRKMFTLQFTFESSM